MLRDAIASSAPPPRPRSVPPATIASDFADLRAAVVQLADGLSAIHAAGKLHCDIKPSNVLVGGGRVVILDFGISMDWTPGRAAAPESLRGTPEYMAPEQAMYMASSPASDWYSVGVMLYEALTGRLPFEGAPLSIMLAKQRGAPPRPREVAPGVPGDLDELCMSLLARDAAARPAGPQVKAMLTGSAPPPVSQSRPTTPRTADELFIGRAPELETLRKAAEQTMLGEPLAMWVSGRSGMGKTALVERFLGEARRGGMLVLSGRCYERESVPYKAFDSLVDAVSRHLAQLPTEELGDLLPRHIRELSMLFPVLRSVPSVEARAGGGEHDALEPHELRRRAFAALRELFAALGARRPMVLHVDDVQWGDAESATLLSALLSEDPLSPRPRLLLLLVFRSEHAEDSPLLAGTRHLRAGRAGTRHLELGEIGDAEALEIAHHLLGGRPRLEAQAASIAREARGSPFFLTELVRYEEERDERHAAGDPPSRRAVSLEQVLLTRVSRLPDDARRLLETLCIAGGPLPLAVAMRAAGLEITGPASLAALRAVKLARTHARGLGTEIEPFHDRIRETVADNLAERARRELAGHLAVELAASGADAETVLEQFLAAGDPERGAAFARTAADKAQESLAFDRAARLYAVAIELRGGDAPWPLLRAHAEALSFAGRGREAGAAWLAASRAAPDGAATEDRRLAAEQLLKSGDEVAGTRLLREVCGEVGLFFPGSAQAALAALV
ncbi:MAG: AAA family ATPase [Polyangiaceae bacterium]